MLGTLVCSREFGLTRDPTDLSLVTPLQLRSRVSPAAEASRSEISMLSIAWPTGCPKARESNVILRRLAMLLRETPHKMQFENGET